MNPRVKEVYPNQNYTIKVIFDNGEEKLFDVSPYLDKGIFSELKNKSLFATVKPFLGSVQWKNGQDFCPDTLYIDGKPCPDQIAKNNTGHNSDMKTNNTYSH